MFYTEEKEERVGDPRKVLIRMRWAMILGGWAELGAHSFSFFIHYSESVLEALI